jgi:hypothetical protein
MTKDGIREKVSGDLKRLYDERAIRTDPARVERTARQAEMRLAGSAAYPERGTDRAAGY